MLDMTDLKTAVLDVGGLESDPREEPGRPPL
jgi:hypothetical protein